MASEQTDGARALGEFLERNKLSQVDLCAAIGVTKAAASDWLAGTKRPRAHHRRAIEIWTDGGVAEFMWEFAEERAVADGVVPFRAAGPDDSGAPPAIDLKDAS